MNIRGLINFLVNTIGLPKSKVASLAGTNVKMLDSILASNDGEYVLMKQAKEDVTMSKGL